MNAPTITSISAVPLDMRLHAPFKFASGSLEVLYYVLVRIESEAGIVGYGECPCWHIPRGETQDSTLDAIRSVSKSIIGLGIVDADQRLEFFRKYIPKAHAAQCGIDLACYDILGKVLNKPVFSFFGAAKPVAVDAVVPLVELKQAAEIARRALESGIKVFKVKVGVDLKREAELLKVVRECIGQKATLFVDANQGWSDLTKAKDAITVLSAMNLAWVEQPLPVSAKVDDFRDLFAGTGVPIMLDESIYTSEDAAYFAEHGAAQYFNIKLAKSGGISEARKIVEVAAKNGIGCMLGSMLDGALVTLAGVHFASTHPVQITALSAVNLINDPLAFGPQINNGCMSAPESYDGLGYPAPELFEERFTA